MRYLIPMFLCASAFADNLIEIPGGFVWNGGVATEISGGWIGSGWDSFPGINPPWNPVALPVVPASPVVVQATAPRQCVQATVAPRRPTVVGYLRICGGEVPVIRMRE